MDMQDDFGRDVHKLSLLAEFPIARGLCHIVNLIIKDAENKGFIIDIFDYTKIKRIDIDQACDSLGFSKTILGVLDAFVKTHDIEHSGDTTKQNNIFKLFVNSLICQHVRLSKLIMKNLSIKSKTSNNLLCKNEFCDSIYCKGECKTFEIPYVVGKWNH
jgi:hypothetical protein